MRWGLSARLWKKTVPSNPISKGEGRHSRHRRYAMAAMNIFSQAVDSELVEEFLPVASPETRRAIQQLLSCKKRAIQGIFLFRS
jgi:hypothetical protein